MKICFFTHYSDMLGANQSLLLLIQHLSKIDEVEIQVVLPASGAMETRLKNLNIATTIIPFHYSYCSAKLNWKGKLISLFQFLGDSVNSLFKLHNFAKFDIIYSNSSVISYGLIISRFLSIKHIWHIREYGYQDYSLIPVYGSKLQAFLTRKSEKLIFISQHLKQTKKNWYKDSKRASVIYNGVKLDQNINLKLKIFDNSHIEFCFAGLMSEKKNAIEGLDLLEALALENIKATYFIYSRMEGRYADRFINEVNSRNLNGKVHFMGFVENLSDSIKDYHFLLMPSRNEAMGRVSIEAMAVGVPVIGFNGGGTAELFEDGISGIYYNDISEAKDKIKSMDKSDYLRMSHSSIDTAYKRFSAENYSKQIFDICKELVQKG